MENRHDEWTKLASTLIPFLALVAAISSAVAAWQSWKTAAASLQIAEQTLEESGALIWIGRDATLAGDCNAGHDQITIDVSVGNRGKLSTNVSGVFVELREAGFLEPIDEPGLTSARGGWSGELQVPAQEAEEIPIHVPCDLLGEGTLLARDATAISQDLHDGAILIAVTVQAENGTLREANIEYAESR
jgi:hypothetical protein